MHGIISMSMELRDTLKCDCLARIPATIISGAWWVTCG
jgi:hypothetical protein